MSISQKVPPKFFCIICDYNTSRKSQYERHLLTPKHKILIIPNINNNKKFYYCKCSKMYRHMSSLCAHKNKCTFIEPLNNEPKNTMQEDLIKQLILQNQQLIFDNKEFKELMIDQSSKMFEQNSKMMELVTTPHSITNNNNTNNTNCHNKQFNLQVFLNEKCKNAMNMTDFVSSLEIMSDDLEDIGKLGYVQGISNIFMKGLKDLDETERPIHCTDKKRETLYIKNSNVWDKDDNREKMNLVIKELAHKNFKYIPIWTDANPSYNDGTTKKNDQYMRIVNQVMTCISPDDESGFNKIIKNVASRVCIDKEASN
jgi:hypothetical protein